jgi:hypothetical protein
MEVENMYPSDKQYPGLGSAKKASVDKALRTPMSTLSFGEITLSAHL